MFRPFHSNLATVFVAVMALTLLSVATSRAESQSVKPLLQKALPNIPGKTFTAMIVSFPPGAKAAPHRHGQAFVYAYVLEGAIKSQLDDGAPRTFQTGQSWFENPGAHHVMTENVSTTGPARLLVVFVSNTGDPLKVDDAAPGK